MDSDVADISRWSEYGRAHAEAFGDAPPATAMIEVKSLIDPQMLIEIEADALVAQDASFTMHAVGTVESSRKEAIDDNWDDVRSTIAFDPKRFGPASLKGLSDFSHVEVIYAFHRVEVSQVECGARHPRGNPAWPKVGIFAQRAKDRPNRIGTTICKIEGEDGLRLNVSGLDAIDGTPVLDVKPYLREFGPRGELSQPRWSTELMRSYWKAETK